MLRKVHVVEHGCNNSAPDFGKARLSSSVADPVVRKENYSISRREPINLDSKAKSSVLRYAALQLPPDRQRSLYCVPLHFAQYHFVQNLGE